MTMNILSHKPPRPQARHRRCDKPGQLYIVVDASGRLVDTYRVGSTSAGPVSGLSVVAGLPTAGFSQVAAS